MEIKIIAYILLIISLVIHLRIVSYVKSKGLNVRERFSWLIGSISFVCGLVSGLAVMVIMEKINSIDSLIISFSLGAIFMLTTIANGVVMRHHQDDARVMEKKIKVLYQSLKRRNNRNYFSRLAERILEKFL